MDVLVLYFRGEALREFPLGRRPIEVGRHRGCDIVVHDEAVAERQLVVRRRGAEVVAYDVSRGRRPTARRLSLQKPLSLGKHHAICRETSRSRLNEAMTPRTDMVSVPAAHCRGVRLLVQAGNQRGVEVSDRPVHVGSLDGQNDLVLSDPTVSGRHFRLDPSGDGFLLRDLGSLNGTWVEGLAVQSARLRAGARIRAGRTNLVLTADAGEREPALVAASPAMQAVLRDVESYGRLTWPVLVTGPSGAGKEGIARALHDGGSRATGPFVALNAGGLPRHLVESELFGHEKGAFTGAAQARRGAFEQADGGTLFLDEIGELPHELQSRLLRVLETFEVRRVGAEKLRPVDVRVVCATHCDLRAMVRRGTFREDLYYRLARLVIDVPPLSARPEDIEPLAVHFLAQAQSEVGLRRLSDEAAERLLSHRWPGNARELRNVVTAAAVATPAEVIQRSDLDLALARLSDGGDGLCGLDDSAIDAVLDRHRGNVTAAARALGIPRSTLRGRLSGRRSAANPVEPA